MLKSMKKNLKSTTGEDKKSKSKTNIKNKTAALSNSTSIIPDYFKNVPTTSSVCDEPKQSDSRTVYVQALKDRLKNCNGGKENFGDDATMIRSENGHDDIADDNWLSSGIAVSASSKSDRQIRKGAGIVDVAVDDRDNRQGDGVAVSASSKSDRKIRKGTGVANLAVDGRKNRVGVVTSVTGQNDRQIQKGTGIVDVAVDDRDNRQGDGVAVSASSKSDRKIRKGTGVANLAVDGRKNRVGVVTSVTGQNDRQIQKGTGIVDVAVDDRDNRQGDDVADSASSKSDRQIRKGTGVANLAVDGRNNKQHVNIADSASGESDGRRAEGAGVGLVPLDDNDDEVDVNGNGRLCNDAPCALLRKKYRDLKKEHFLLCRRHCEQSIKYDQLIETLNAVRKAEPSNDEDPNAPSSSYPLFTNDELRTLKGVPLNKHKDSNFILQCIEFAYKDNKSTLVNKTLFGKPERVEFFDSGAVVVEPAKDPLTPEKVRQIKELFIKRVYESKCLPAELADRVASTKINRHFATAIGNVTTKQNPPKKVPKNVNLNL